MFKVELQRDDHWEVIAVFEERCEAEKFAHSNVDLIPLNPSQEDLILAVARFEIRMDKQGNEHSVKRDDDDFDDVRAEHFFDLYDVKDGIVHAPTRKAALKKVHDFRVNAIAIGAL